MADKLQDLLTRVYEEGVNKARDEAEDILEKAKKQAEEIVEMAKEDAKKTLEKAQKEAEELKKNGESDLRTATEHTMNSVKQKLAEVFLDEAFDPKLAKDLADPDFLKKAILEVISAWQETEGNITISKKLEDKLDGHFLNSVKEAAGKGMKIDFSPQMKNGFEISPKDGSYKLSFTDEDFANLFKSFLRKRTQNLLFKK